MFVFIGHRYVIQIPNMTETRPVLKLSSKSKLASEEWLSSEQLEFIQGQFLNFLGLWGQMGI
jgi:hypothetical protein